MDTTTAAEARAAEAEAALADLYNAIYPVRLWLVGTIPNKRGRAIVSAMQRAQAILVQGVTPTAPTPDAAGE